MRGVLLLLVLACALLWSLTELITVRYERRQLYQHLDRAIRNIEAYRNEYAFWESEYGKVKAISADSPLFAPLQMHPAQLNDMWHLRESDLPVLVPASQERQ